MLLIYTSRDGSSHFNDGDLSSRAFLVGFLHSARDQAATSFPPLLKRVLGCLKAQLGLWRRGGAAISSIKDLGFINKVSSQAFPKSATLLISVPPPDCTILSCWLFSQSK